ncbi:GNAT family acetyltransferase [Brevibacillus borstelensis]|jgi:ribosomal protein S18 acetylase RimI-like enzyme|uniref:GNAT family acetyltransferase n=1 Tax=Brevibacillus borstelensis TaxID=45462 RepID=UPI000F089B8E|nr:GNAT family acetyltransferase [Brevibacillus borstelensis]MCC0564619.1 GNAT family acetyltransferase [Brevibacillus borstelensis]MCM3558086.1 GNAT family acetyltransferase [Brevibacillus borstelensis]MED1854243.1 GNAT family acetyltransferase [Brevibacillus borstelensis]MED1885532.1 GNAT family acetyltransferase [Brevibacillus borstelensis]NOU53349.1 GNAT family acetyltransferase [Brevibacillus borstelensis]
MDIRSFQMTDYEAVVELWMRAGLTLSPSDSREAIEKKLQRDPELFLVATEQDQLIGAVMGAFDGRRGWVYHLAVDPQCQGKQIGRLLMNELEERMRAVGCDKMNLLVAQDNVRVGAFYQKLGFTRDDVFFMGKWINRLS